MSAGSYEVGAKGRDFATCPVCGGEDWCFVIFEGGSPKINCKREESSEVSLDGTVWRKVNESPKLGTNYVLKDALDEFVRQQKEALAGLVGSGKGAGSVAYKPKPKAIPAAIELKPQVLPPQTEVMLLSFELPKLGWSVVSEDSVSTERQIEYRYPSIQVDVTPPVAGNNDGKRSVTRAVPNEGVDSSGSGNRSDIDAGSYRRKQSATRGGSDDSFSHRSPVEVMVTRRQWDDRRSVYHKKRKADGSWSAKSKMILPKHRFSGGDWATGKPRVDGKALDWPLYRWDEVVAYKPPVLCWAAGEKCVESLRELGYIAVSQSFGENASETAVVAVVRQVGQALVDGLSQLVLVFVDEDEAGIKFGNEVHRVASQLFPHRFLVLRMPLLEQMVSSDRKSANNRLAYGIQDSTCKNEVGDIADLVEQLTKDQRDSLRTRLSAFVAEVSKKNSKDNMTTNSTGQSQDPNTHSWGYREFDPNVSHTESLPTEGVLGYPAQYPHQYPAHVPSTNAGMYVQPHQPVIADPCKIRIGNAVVDTARLFDYSHKKGAEQLKVGAADGFSRAMAAATQGLAYDSEASQWYTFPGSGIWEPLSDEDMAYGVQSVCHSIGSSLNRAFLFDVCYFLSLNLGKKGWGGSDTQVFFPNGKLDLMTGSFTELTEEDLCLGTLSFCYDTSGNTDCPQIREFLELFNGETLVYGIAAALRQMGYLQRFIHLIGVPGSGKGTCLRLVRACLGTNAVSTTLEGMENRFETAKFRDARAILVPEGADVRIDPTVLKSLTGSDQVAYELKHSQQTKDNSFVFTGIVFLATNGLPRWSESSAGAIKRRALYIQLSSVPPEPKILLEFARNGDEEILMGDFATEMPQFFNWVVSLTKSDIAAQMKQRNADLDMGMFLESNPVAKWFDQCCYASDALNHRGKFLLRIVVGNSDKPGSLYHSYFEWCESNGEKPLNARRLQAEVKLLLDSQSIPHDLGRSSEGNTFFGICLAGEDSSEFPLSDSGDQWEEDD